MKAKIIVLIYISSSAHLRFRWNPALGIVLGLYIDKELAYIITLNTVN